MSALLCRECSARITSPQTLAMVKTLEGGLHPVAVYCQPCGDRRHREMLDRMSAQCRQSPHDPAPRNTKDRDD
jgi:hypothetical protein